MTTLAVEPFQLPPRCVELAGRSEDALRGFLEDQRTAIVGPDPGASAAFDELERVVWAGGKRLRPVFCCLGYLATGAEEDERLFAAAAALELLHTFALVHDDVMDRSPTRRGTPTTWIHLAERHRREGWRGDPVAYGISAAVLVGDLAIALADQAFMRSGFASDRLLPGAVRYHRMRTDMVAGQFLDVEASQRTGISEAAARRIAVLKSGAYTVEGPLQIGASLAGSADGLLDALSRYGTALGEAFQLRDDLLGSFGDPSVTGKDRDSDLREGKRTVPVALALAAAPEADRRFLEERLGHADLSDDEVERMRGIVERSGAVAATIGLVEDLSEEARRSAAEAPVPPEVASLLVSMVDALAARPM